jgi:hypothetical protein
MISERREEVVIIDYHAMQTLAQSIDRSSYILAGAIKEAFKQREKERSRELLLAAFIFGASSSLLTIILYVILRR